MRGYWLNRSNGIFATQKTPYLFDKMCRSLNRRGDNCHNREFFVPEFECTEEFRNKNIPVEEDLDSDVLDQLVANVEFTATSGDDDSLNRQIKQARKQKLLTETKLLGQKLQERKKQLFYGWSQNFFQSFANHFGKLKNCLVQMHLNQQQVKIFNQTLQKCLQNMQLDLNNMWNQFEKEQQNEEGKQV